MSRTIHERNLGNDMDNHIFEIRGKFYKGHCFPGLNDYIHGVSMALSKMVGQAIYEQNHTREEFRERYGQSYF